MGAVHLPDVQQFNLFAFLELVAIALPAAGRAVHGFILVMAVTNKCKHIERVITGTAKTVQVLSYGCKSYSRLINCEQRGGREKRLLINHLGINGYF